MVDYQGLTAVLPVVLIVHKGARNVSILISRQ